MSEPLLSIQNLRVAFRMGKVKGVAQRTEAVGRGAEGVEEAVLEDLAQAELDAGAHRLDPGTMAETARTPPALGPAAVAVHDDGDMARQPVGSGRGRGTRGAGHRAESGGLRPPSTPSPWPGRRRPRP